tara:strand:- start:22109 stop:22321 length:213 start_codon:yes stop_codon:yes gene_type:complete
MTDDDFDFGVSPEETTLTEIALAKEIADLHVLVDTLQSLLGSGVSELKRTGSEAVITSMPSYKWAAHWRA